MPWVPGYVHKKVPSVGTVCTCIVWKVCSLPISRYIRGVSVWSSSQADERWSCRHRRRASTNWGISGKQSDGSASAEHRRLLDRSGPGNVVGTVQVRPRAGPPVRLVFQIPTAGEALMTHRWPSHTRHDAQYRTARPAGFDVCSVTSQWGHCPLHRSMSSRA